MFTRKPEFAQKIADQPRYPNADLGWDAPTLQASFDRNPEELRIALNQLMDELEENGASSIGITESIPGSGTTVEERALWLYNQIASVVLGQIPDGSITDIKLSDAPEDIKQRLIAISQDLESHKNDIAPHGLFNYQTELTNDAEGNLVKIIEKSGATPLQETNLNYTDGQLTSADVTIFNPDGVSIKTQYTETLNYDASGNLTSVDKVVV